MMFTFLEVVPAVEPVGPPPIAAQGRKK